MNELNDSLKKLAELRGGDEATHLAEEIVHALGVRCPRAPEIELVLENLSVFSSVGRGEALLEAVATWREAYPDAVERIERVVSEEEEILHKSFAFRLGDEDFPGTRCVDVVNAFLEGDLDTALACVRENGWFLNDPGSATGFAYGMWILALQREFDEAEDVLARWKKANLGKDARADVLVMRAEAAASGYKGDFERECRVLEAAIKVASENGLEREGRYTEPLLAAAYAHAAEFELADELTSDWAREESPGEILEVYRNFARAEIALLSRRWDDALSTAGTILEEASVRRNPIHYQQLRFIIALASPEESYREALDEFALAVGMLPTRRMMSRVDDLERLWKSGVASPRETNVLERTRDGARSRALARVWYSRSAVAADFYFDLVRCVIYVDGHGPHFPASYPKRRKLLTFLASQEDMSASADAVYEAVWGASYDPSKHENKLHVTAHRVRQLLSEWASDPERDFIRVRDGKIAIHAEDIRVLQLENGEAYSLISSLDERIVNLLRGGHEMSAADFEKLLDVSRSSLHMALKRLIKEERITRIGAGRKIAYLLASDDA